MKKIAILCILLPLLLSCPLDTENSDNDDTNSAENEETEDEETVEDTTPPGEVQNIAATPGNESIELSWDPPPDEDLDHYSIDMYIMQWITSTYYNTTQTEVLVDNSTELGLNLSDLTNGDTYYFTVYTHDTSGNKSEGVDVNCTPDSAKVKFWVDVIIGTSNDAFAQVTGIFYINGQFVHNLTTSDDYDDDFYLDPPYKEVIYELDPGTYDFKMEYSTWVVPCNLILRNDTINGTRTIESGETVSFGYENLFYQ